MSTLKAEVVRVEKVEPHPNADRLEIATIKGWQCVVGKGEFKAGDAGYYFPIDSVLPEALLNFLFVGTKLKPPTRIKTIKLRGEISQGLLSRRATSDGGLIWEAGMSNKIGEDVTDIFGVTKYEPPQKDLPNLMRCGSTRVNHPDFQKYTDIENWKNYPKVFEDDEWVLVTEKIHGTSFRCGWVPYFANTFWKRLKKLFGFAPEYEFVFGSRNVQLTEKSDTFYGKNVYAEIVEKYDLKRKLKPGEVLYGEIYGDGIQKGYSYGCANDEHRFAAFDMMKNGEWMDACVMLLTLENRSIPIVPVHLYCEYDMDNIMPYVIGRSTLGDQVKEGVVIRGGMGAGRHPLLGRKILKVINAEYLLRDQSDWH